MFTGLKEKDYYETMRDILIYRHWRKGGIDRDLIDTKMDISELFTVQMLKAYWGPHTKVGETRMYSGQ